MLTVFSIIRFLSMLTVTFPVIKKFNYKQTWRRRNVKNSLRSHAVRSGLVRSIWKMVFFPTRKCYHAIKIAILLILVFTLLSLFEQWRGGKRSAVAVNTSILSPEEEEFERQILEDESLVIPGLGEGGVAAHLTGEDKRLGEESEKKLAMNVYLSDRIAYNRTLKGKFETRVRGYGL